MRLRRVRKGVALLNKLIPHSKARPAIQPVRII